MQQWHFVLPRLLGAVLLWVSVAAQAGSLPSTLSFEGGGDAQGSRDQYLDLDYAFVGDSRLLASVAHNRSDSQNNPITTRSVLLGFRTDPLEPLSVGMDLETWGKKGSLETDTLRMVMDVSLQHWQFSLRPQWRTLTFSPDCVGIRRRFCQSDTEVKSTGMALDVSYYTDGPWSFSLGFARYQYDRRVEVLALDPRLEFVFSAATLNLSTGLEDRRSSITVFYFSHDALWSFSWLKSTSRVTGEASFVQTLRFSTDLSEQWRLRLRVGRQTLENGRDPVSFASAGLAYSW
ncbi:hypothetical protein MNBD_GAMMA19-2213 [hydrothermal vent metagenome]|uniref:Uncharacterized protein n=1 Tax=hydrothermal vent metagenome TaxID=652676 RepID=A0A3B1B893_9ZZZZ